MDPAHTAKTPRPRKKRKPLARRLRHFIFDTWLFYAAMRVIIWAIAVLPRPVTQMMGASCGRMAYWLDRGHRALCFENLKTAFPEKSQHEHRAILKACYTHFGLCAFDFWRLTRVREQDLLGKLIFPDPDAETIRDAAFAEGKGVIGVASHIGFWELGGFAMKVLGYDCVTVSRKFSSPRAEAFISKVRQRFGNRIVPQKGALVAILRALKENKAAGILTDLHAGHNHPWIPFFGKEASMFDTCAKLHLKTGAPLLQGVMARRPDSNYRWRVKRIDPGPLHGTEDEKIRQILLAINRELEAAIREHPEQWVWMNNRWREKSKT